MLGGVNLVIYCFTFFLSCLLTSSTYGFDDYKWVSPGESIDFEVELLGYNRWLSDKKFFDKYGPITANLIIHEDRIDQVRVKGSERLPLDVEVVLQEELKNLEEILFWPKILKEKNDEDLTEAVFKGDEKSNVEYKVKLDEDLRSKGKKFIKDIIIKQGDLLEIIVNISWKLNGTRLTPDVITIKRNSRSQIFASKDHFYERGEEISFKFNKMTVIP